MATSFDPENLEDLYFGKNGNGRPGVGCSEEGPVYGTAGLDNMGNTCYMNSTIQCLSNVLPFREYILHHEYVKNLILNIKKEDDSKTTSDIKLELNQKLTYQIWRLLRVIWESSFESFKPVTFKQLFGEKITFFQGYQQHDSQEALACILDTVHMETAVPGKVTLDNPSDEIIELIRMNEFLDNTIDDNSIDPVYKMELVQQYTKFKIDNRAILAQLKAFQSKKIHLGSSMSFITQIFQGYLHSAITCPHCGNGSDTFDPFFYLSVPIPEGDGPKDSPTNNSPTNNSPGSSTSSPEPESPIVSAETLATPEPESPIVSAETLATPDLEDLNKDPFLDDGSNSGSTVEFDEYIWNHWDNHYSSMTSSSFFQNQKKKLEKKEPEIVLDDTEFTVVECIRQFISEEFLDDDNRWNCQNCQEAVNASKQIKLWEAPQILIIHIKRFHKTPTVTLKKKNMIHFPIQGLQIKEFLSPFNQTEETDPIYDLFAINNHQNHGKLSNINHGHYYSYCLNCNDNKWYEFNDDDVTEVEEGKLETENAYMLFYKLRD